MDRRDEGRERMVVASQESQSVVKLPLAPILSIPHSSNNNNNSNAATVSTRRGISIFSPTQTLDHNTFPPPPPPPPPPQPQPDPDPTTSTSTTPRNQELIISTTSSATPVLIRYRECQKNHAANMGGHVVDGCGEFMPSGEPGTPESLRCAACDCHRNFHRKEVENSHHYQHQHQHQHHQHHSNHVNNRSHGGRGMVGPRMVNFGGGGESSSEEMNLAQPCSYSGSKKRFRTKFSQEQKDKMHELAERLGWRMQKQNEGEVQQLCNELGVKRQVFKVWMHNNKQAMKKRQTEE